MIKNAENYVITTVNIHIFGSSCTQTGTHFNCNHQIPFSLSLAAINLHSDSTPAVQVTKVTL